jgi:hypothetical protein
VPNIHCIKHTLSCVACALICVQYTLGSIKQTLSCVDCYLHTRNYHLETQRVSNLKKKNTLNLILNAAYSVDTRNLLGSTPAVLTKELLRCPHSLQASTRIIFQIRRRPVPSTSCPINYSLIILQFDEICPEIPT